MHELFLVIHFIGLAMGVGTSFAFMFLGIARSKMESTEALKFQSNTMILMRMGHIGLTLLVISGLYLITPYWSSLGDTPLLILKLVLVLVLGGLLGALSVTAKKAMIAGEPRYLKRLEILGKTAFLTALLIIIMAVLVFQ